MARQAFTLELARENSMAIRQVARYLGMTQRHRLMKRSPRTIAYSLEEWQLAGAASFACSTRAARCAKTFASQPRSIALPWPDKG
jgi:hypothetical protein